jgi:hypothetical protein
MNDISTFSDDAKIWIFQANKPLDKSIQEDIEKRLSSFCEQWTSHGALMKAAFTISFDRFIIVALDESAAVISGCGQDKLIHVIQELGSIHSIDFFDRLQTLYFQDEEIVASRLHEFWGLRKANVVTNETRVFDNTVKKLGEWKSKWIVPFAHSWHAEMWGK